MNIKFVDSGVVDRINRTCLAVGTLTNGSEYRAYRICLQHNEVDLRLKDFCYLMKSKANPIYESTYFYIVDRYNEALASAPGLFYTDDGCKIKNQRAYFYVDINRSLKLGHFSKERDINEMLSKTIESIIEIRRSSKAFPQLTCVDYIIVLKESLDNQLVHGILELIPSSSKHIYKTRLHSTNPVSVSDFVKFLCADDFYKNKRGYLKVACDDWDFTFNNIPSGLRYNDEQHYDDYDIEFMASHHDDIIVDTICRHIPDTNIYDFVLLVKNQIDNDIFHISTDEPIIDISSDRNTVCAYSNLDFIKAYTVTDFLNAINNMDLSGQLYICKNYDDVSITSILLDECEVLWWCSHRFDPVLPKMYEKSVVIKAYINRVYYVDEDMCFYNFYLLIENSDSFTPLDEFINNEMFVTKDRIVLNANNLFIIRGPLKPKTTLSRVVREIERLECDCSKVTVGISTNRNDCQIKDHYTDDYTECSWDGYILYNHRNHCATDILLRLYYMHDSLVLDRCIIAVDDNSDFNQTLGVPVDIDTRIGITKVGADIAKLYHDVSLYLPWSSNTQWVCYRIKEICTQLNNSIIEYSNRNTDVK